MKLPNFQIISTPRFYFYMAMIFFGILYCTIYVANHYFFRSSAFDYGPYNFAFWDYSHFHVSPCPIYNVFFDTNLYVTVLEEHSDFGIYLFNNDDKAVWFDDLTVVTYKKIEKYFFSFYLL